jgi:hypothetical protein
MGTYQEELEALGKNYHRGLRELNQRRAFMEAMPAWMFEDHEVSVYPYKLYDRVGSITLKLQRYESIRQRPNPTIDTLRKLAQSGEFADTAVYSDGSVGIRTLADAKRELEKAEARNPDTKAAFSPSAPFWLEFDPGLYSQILSVHSILNLSGVGLIDVRVEFSIHGEVARKIGTVHVRRSGFGNIDPEHRQVIENKLTLTPAVTVIGDARANQIRYASGSQYTPGHHVVYWDSGTGEPSSITLSDLYRELL